MFSIFDLRNSRDLADYEKEYLMMLLNEAKQKEEFRWLNQLHLNSICIKECPKMSGTDILGAFTPLAPDSIFIQRLTQYVPGRPFWLEIVFSTILHELRHMFQFKKNRILYFLCTLPFIRNLTIERDAGKQALLAENFILAFSPKLDTAEYKKRFNKIMEIMT